MYYTTKSFWMTGSISAGEAFLDTVDRYYFPISRSIASSTTRWTVAKNASGSYSPMTGSVTATVFTTKPQPTAIPDAPGGSTPSDGWLLGPFTGTFTASAFTFQIEATGTTISAQKGFFQYKLWKSPDVSGSTGTTAITPTFQQTNNRSISASFCYFTGSFKPTSSITFNNQYLILETAWAITVAGGSNSANVVVRVGSSSWFSTPAFEDNSLIILSDDDNPGLK